MAVNGYFIAVAAIIFYYYFCSCLNPIAIIAVALAFMMG
jgi:hypothetical protein